MKTINKYLRKYWEEIDPGVLFYMRRILFGMILNDKETFSRLNGKMICSACYSHHNFSDDIANQKARLKREIQDIQKKFDATILPPDTHISLKKKFIAENLSSCISKKHEANLHCFLTMHSETIPSVLGKRKDAIYQVHKDLLNTIQKIVLNMVEFKELSECIEEKSLTDGQSEIESEEDENESSDESCINVDYEEGEIEVTF